jgi:hypothetical protein
VLLAAGIAALQVFGFQLLLFWRKVETEVVLDGVAGSGTFSLISLEVFLDFHYYGLDFRLGKTSMRQDQDEKHGAYFVRLVYSTTWLHGKEKR